VFDSSFSERHIFIPARYGLAARCASRGKIVQAKGDYLWIVKDNRHELYQDIQTLFAPSTSRPGWSAPPTDFRTAQTLEKGHGRLEKRHITVSSLLANYSDWPGLTQVFKLESQFTDALGQTHQEVRYGVTSLLTSQANARRLLALVRGHWGIENVLHYRGDVTLREDKSQLRMGHAPHLLAVLNNTALGLFARQGVTNVAEARREFAYQVDKALHSLAS
jgi:predicted transposase YbfD/YdcC